MSVDDYDKYILQKHRLALSIAIIKTKPENLTINKYIDDLKTNINKMDDLDITLCSDDFNIDDEQDEQIVENDKFNDIATILKEFDSDLTNLEENMNNDQNVIQENTQSTFCESLIQERQTCKQNYDDLTYCSQIEVNQNNCFNINEINNLKIEKNKKIDCYKEVFNKNHKIGYNNNGNENCPNTNSVSNKLKTDKDLVENNNTTKNIYNNINFVVNKEYTADSQETQLYTVPEFTQNSHYSQTQSENIFIPQRYIVNKAKHTNIKVDRYTQDDINTSTKYVMYNADPSIKSNEVIESQNTAKLNEHLQSINRHTNLNDINTFCDELEVIPGSSYVIGNLTKRDDFSEIRIQNEQRNQNSKPIASGESKTTDVNDLILHNIDNKNENLHTYEEITQTVDFTTNFTKSKENTQNFDTEIIENGQNYAIANITDSDQSFEHENVVPFKILEELSKIKNYLLKRNERRMSYDGLSGDSGYRSNSQSKHSERTFLQNANNWVNQSAYTVFNYIKTCPINANTNDIADEISHILGQLIDKLHEEETYPTFLEELLEHVASLLENILKAPKIEEALLKEEYIHRLLLLNRSLNIVKYTIEKLTDILQCIQAQITDKNVLYEITNTTEVENLSYIFHILEILIRRYVKNKNLSQTTLLSQESSITKSSITDIWRKKWNPEYKENLHIEGSCEKKCVLLKCSEILNKIILDCMEGYSLVSYSALQCFNVMQQD